MKYALEFYILSGDISLLVAIIIFFCFGLHLRKKQIENNKLAKVYIFIFSNICFYIFYNIWMLSSANTFGFNKEIVVDIFIFNSELLILFFSFWWAWSTFDYFKALKERAPVFEIFLLILLAIQAMFCLVKSNNLFIIYIAIELQSLCFYILIAIKRYSNNALESSLKYLILSVFMTALAVFGISFLYGIYGTINITQLQFLLNIPLQDNAELIQLSIIAIFCGVFFKLAIFPFHIWAPDIYSSTNLIIISFMSIISKISFLVILIRLMFLFQVFYSIIFFLFSILGVLAIIYGTIVAIYQTKLLRLLAYSTIVHMGYILLSLSLQNLESIVAACYSFIIYGCISLGLFTILISFRTKDGWEIKFVTDIVHLIRDNLPMAFILASFFLSLAGLPPFAGFCGKFLIFMALIKGGNFFIAFIILLTNVLTVIYYIRLIRFLFFISKLDTLKFQINSLSWINATVIIIFFLLNINLIFIQNPFLLFLTNIIIESFFLDCKYE